MIVNLTGIQAESKKSFATFQTLRPAGMVTLVHDAENKFDPYCIRVIYETQDSLVCLGYIPGQKTDGVYTGSELQRYVIDNKITTAAIASYGYIDGDEFNDEHRGHLQSVTINLTIPDNDSGKAVGGKYLRVTDFISYFSPYGKSDGLIKWAFEQSDTYEGYQKALNELAEAGTKTHLAIECYLNGDRSERVMGALPDGWKNFEKKYEIDVIEMEQRFYDNTLGVSGQPDLVCYLKKRGSDDPFVLTVVDWKSSKKSSIKHLLQLAIYSKNKSFDGNPVEQAMVVCFGAETKQGFSATTYKRSKIESAYQAMAKLKEVMDLAGIWIPDEKYFAFAG